MKHRKMKLGKRIQKLFIGDMEERSTICVIGISERGIRKTKPNKHHIHIYN